ncbi:MAG: hypothetical protein A2487_09305 [Candidatus Raymondbacteria bacterium RifOxyC12_full_50_8]|uniref:Glycoside hydrolase n=1 Tax=Candidatus Raymondbacteria bacterium RIFOXYD12_FULL_49_13 TaxID=1817890 RepID=A0A1F7FI56_UNCRA|nr:MAG: hypothetical protein A2248_21420 [Candidatus Raymondbacteria bacterium RIFOXYA2_FULL_49_16]OGJ96776.1 MAG: hypothetical protein A2487_09305 [Candidatus Raymondbacteria bacterium RifOxyC12_full_50_8]OGJ98672.1 MAG: hypothetical protein A2350_14070 [Candidatus Raymondbacteria bacterium RifOxyB12_full_50_8]OGK06370.1 MAG: hypothetical protein A2519_08740 [Candidatus Raymondbacteria bacterium RIFOXYD12_FULL_49_13]OGP40704.1 MAG: hypothetical protein A2324_03490 [Candidatus Raymondbacteria b
MSWVFASADAPIDALAWPQTTREARPGAYWWWMGSAVDTTNLARELQEARNAGLGTVHIVPIYGAKGCEGKYISYLTPQWMEMLRYAITKAKQFDLNVDMSTGTGWCFGGPHVTEKEANASVVAETFWFTPDAVAGKKLNMKFDRLSTQALMAFSPEGAAIELTDKIGPDSTVNWSGEKGTWRMYAVSQRPSGQMVKRAAPGGEGNMLNLLYPEAVRHYMQGFDQAFSTYKGPMPRAMYHDSYEYHSNWSPDFFTQFEKRRGYRLQSELEALFGNLENDHTARVKSDYRETISDIMAEESLPLWADWSRQHGFLTRNQAHGSPGNLLDLYALADIPETEMHHIDRNIFVSKFASSAAHVMGKNLIASETGTWLQEHFTETLADLKGIADDFFLSGVNHIFYHGMCYSPSEAAWPGWVFYASTQMNSRNSIWRDAPALNTYVTRCQSILQYGKPDNDVLLYWPIHDRWHNPKGLIQHFSIHAQEWFEQQPIGKTTRQLWNRGFAFDFVSDRQLVMANTVDGSIAMAGGRYRVIVIPSCEHMPVKTLEKLLVLAQSGATIVFEDHLPADVPGVGDLEKRRTEFNQLLGSFKKTIKKEKFGNGRVYIGSNVETMVNSAGVMRESMVDNAGLLYARRSFNGGYHYFITNHGEQLFSGWITLGIQAKTVIIMDPMTSNTGIGAIRQKKNGGVQVYLKLLPNESVILRALTGGKAADGAPWNYVQQTGPAIEIKGTWRVKFIQGGPVLPMGFETDKLASWTGLGNEETRCFAGTAQYAITFEAPALQSKRWILNLGKVCQSARIRINNRDLGTCFMFPCAIPVDQLKPKDNVLEVEITNVPANRIRDLDRRGVIWKNFHNINFVNINYKPFDAADWPLTDAGLLGPVSLTPVSAIPFKKLTRQKQ